MKTKCLLLITLVFATTAAYGQSDFDASGDPPSPQRGPAALLPPDFGFCQDHCSTAGEGWLRGLASVIYARGNYLVNWFQAAILAEQARWLDLSNDQRLIQFNAWKKDRRKCRLDAKRRLNVAKRPAKYLVAYQLTSDQLDPVRGKIVWPKPLQASRYEAQRQELDALFGSWYLDGDCSSDDGARIQSAARSLIRDLTKNRTGVPQAEYFAAQRFLRGLKYESVFRSQVF